MDFFKKASFPVLAISLWMSILATSYVYAAMMPDTYQPGVDSKQVKKEERSFFITSDNISLPKQKKDTILVDVRHSKYFRSVRIPGSINIPPYLLKTKRYLKDKKVAYSMGVIYGSLLNRA